MHCYISSKLWWRVVDFPSTGNLCIPRSLCLHPFFSCSICCYSWTVREHIIWHLRNTPRKLEEMESVLKMCERFGPFIKEAHCFFHVLPHGVLPPILLFSSIFFFLLLLSLILFVHFTNLLRHTLMSHICKSAGLNEDKFTSLWFSIYIIRTSLPRTASYSEVLVVRQLDTSCLGIMTPWGHILSIRHSGWTHRLCVAAGHVCAEGGDAAQRVSIILTCSKVEPHLRVRWNKWWKVREERGPLSPMQGSVNTSFNQPMNPSHFSCPQMTSGYWFSC